jgi:hypothetical protein
MSQKQNQKRRKIHIITRLLCLTYFLTFCYFTLDSSLLHRKFIYTTEWHVSAAVGQVGAGECNRATGRPNPEACLRKPLCRRLFFVLFCTLNWCPVEPEPAKQSTETGSRNPLFAHICSTSCLFLKAFVCFVILRLVLPHFLHQTAGSHGQVVKSLVLSFDLPLNSHCAWV